MSWRVKPLDQILTSPQTGRLKSSLGVVHLTLIGVGATIGTGIFVLTAEAAQKSGPGMMLSFIVAGLVCAFASLCYAELAAMIPRAGSAYTYSYAFVGEYIAWLVGWALILEYILAGSAVAVGWSGYIVGVMQSVGLPGIPEVLQSGPLEGGWVNLPAALVSLAVTGLLVVGTRESAAFNAALIGLKLVVLGIFIVLTVPQLKSGNFVPFAPLGAASIGVTAASIFFAYVGFDSVATAAEEARDPQRTMPRAILACIAICTVFYLLVAAGAIGTVGAEPLFGADGVVLEPGTPQFAAACEAHPAKLVCSREALAFVLREIGWPKFAGLLGSVVGFALPSVILLMIFGQARVFFAMARDGLLPRAFAKVHSRFGTPHVITLVTGGLVALFAGFVPLGRLVDLSNAGTLIAFFVVTVAVVRARRGHASVPRPFRIPHLWLVAPVAGLGCLWLFFSLGAWTLSMTLAWSAIGTLIYLGYGRRRSLVGAGGGDETSTARLEDAESRA